MREDQLYPSIMIIDMSSWVGRLNMRRDWLKVVCTFSTSPGFACYPPVPSPIMEHTSRAGCRRS